ncbi:TetR family transcriptional regulator [Arachidicoccus ginsenosidimutans]|uniref:TetR/AcrR family transcriptional regulator n=1 Tax=Arachidicoccus sp. BS20 TaxID=1850526 RepID=UPI0007F04CC0|nr:TetR/AcrR family transcriptional regulator [Arachidicoccus sp. BS20]ANI89735.1 TetR family transcriptional regulator [Arachidicoccus sp. BS20]
MKQEILMPKDRILETASLLFHRQGYNSTGINQIIDEAKVAKASFYDHFKSKEDLCAAFLNKRHDYWFAQLESFTAKSRTPHTKVLAAFDFIAFMNQKEDFRGCSFLNILSEISSGNNKILPIIQNHKKDLQEFFNNLISEKLLSAHIYLLFESALIESQLFRNQTPVETAKKIVQSLLKK